MATGFLSQELFVAYIQRLRYHGGGKTPGDFDKALVHAALANTAFAKPALMNGKTREDCSCCGCGESCSLKTNPLRPVAY